MEKNRHGRNRRRNRNWNEQKKNTNENSKCGKPLTDIASAMTDKTSGEPVHFECALEQVSGSESLAQNEKIAYIGQGRFAVLSYENIRDQRHFHIKKIIEWEGRDSKPEWRNEMSGLFSQVE